jgi:hypothetical protein
LGNEKRPNMGDSSGKKPGPGDYNVGSKLKGEKSQWNDLTNKKINIFLPIFISMLKSN